MALDGAVELKTSSLGAPVWVDCSSKQYEAESVLRDLQRTLLLSVEGAVEDRVSGAVQAVFWEGDEYLGPDAAESGVYSVVRSVMIEDWL